MILNHFNFIKTSLGPSVATENAAIAASRHIGRGDKLAADRDATDAMRGSLNIIDFAGRIVIGEGKKDDAPGLFAGELVGLQSFQCCGFTPEVYDVAVDPIDGTTQAVKGGCEAMSVLAVGEPCSLFATEAHYMDKIAWGPQLANMEERLRKYWYCQLDIKRLLRLTAAALDKNVLEVTVCVLDRQRHEKLVKGIREAGARVKFIQDCDISGAIATAIPDSGIDLLMGVGGAPEGVIAAVALKCLGGGMASFICDKEGKALDDKILGTDDLAQGEVIFSATGITDGSLLRGVRHTQRGIMTNSLYMHSKPRSVRWIEAEHTN